MPPIYKRTNRRLAKPSRIVTNPTIELRSILSGLPSHGFGINKANVFHGIVCKQTEPPTSARWLRIRRRRTPSFKLTSDVGTMVIVFT